MPGASRRTISSALPQNSPRSVVATVQNESFVFYGKKCIYFVYSRSKQEVWWQQIWLSSRNKVRHRSQVSSKERTMCLWGGWEGYFLALSGAPWITVTQYICISFVNPGLIGNGQQCFDGDCTAGNCTLVTMAGDETDVMSSFRKECILIFKF